MTTSPRWIPRASLAREPSRASIEGDARARTTTAEALASPRGRPRASTPCETTTNASRYPDGRATTRDAGRMRAVTTRETVRTRASVAVRRSVTSSVGGDARARGGGRRCRRTLGRDDGGCVGVGTFSTTRTTIERTRTRARREGDASEESSSRDAVEEKKRAFWETFWETLEEQRGKAPFMKTRRRVETTTTTTETTTETETVRRETDGTARSDTFWGRCTIGGLALAVLMTLSASSLTHWPTAKYAACNPLVFFFDPSGPEAEAKFAIVAEIARRLAKPVVRYFAAWCALRSRWRLMWASFAASCVLPVVYNV